MFNPFKILKSRKQIFLITNRKVSSPKNYKDIVLKGFFHRKLFFDMLFPLNSYAKKAFYSNVKIPFTGGMFSSFESLARK